RAVLLARSLLRPLDGISDLPPRRALVRRRRAAVGKSAPLVMRDPSMLADPQTPVTLRTERGRFRKAAAFALFMSAVATLWVLAPALISWLAAQPLRWSALPVRSEEHTSEL